MDSHRTLDLLLLHDMQVAAIVCGVFICIWGLFEFGRCLIEVLLGKHNQATMSMCPSHAGGAMTCITGIIFCTARANTIGMIQLGSWASGILFIGGIISFCIIIGLGIWAKGHGHGTPLEGQLTGHPALSRIFSMMLIVILAFVLLGLVKAGE